MRQTGRVEKGWGHEQIFATNNSYCGKLLCFSKKGNKCSMHYHLIKDETWHVISGAFVVSWIDTSNGSIHTKILEPGNTWHNPPGLPHQLTAAEDNSVIVEASTADSVEDNYRIFAGDSQSRQ
jgi:quercetin dioxygenase-like cupin family protein